MDLSFIDACLDGINDNMRETIDQLYIKQQSIMEHSQSLDLSEYQCFQEGFFKPGSSSELDVFKFDNKHIIKAIKYFNKAYAEIPFDDTNYDETKKDQERGELDIRKTHSSGLLYSDDLIKKAEACFRNTSGPFEKGLQELQKQFDCKFKVYISEKQGTGTFIENFPKDPGKLTVSKSKGFQLGGLGININVNMRQVMDFVPSDKKLFGQAFAAVLLHEIYHNIVHMIDVRNTKLHNDIKLSIKTAGSANNSAGAISTISNFIDRFMSSFSLKRSDIDKARTERRLYVLSQIQNNPAAMKQFEEDIKHNKDETTNDQEIDDYIEQLRVLKSFLKIGKGMRVVGTACVILLTAVGFIFGQGIAAVSGTVCLALMSLSMLMKKVKSLFGMTPYVKEEYFCDLFAGMYKLPVHLSSFNRQVLLNKNNPEKMKQLRQIDQDISKLTNDEHPITFDREVTSYKLAKQLLKSGQKLSPEIKAYLKYIVDLHEGIDGIDNPENKREAKKLDPKAAEDLRKTMRDFVSKTGATVTESYLMDILGVGEEYGIG